MEKDIDLYLFIPCDLSYFNDKGFNTTETEIGKLLKNEIQKNSNIDFNSEYLRNLERKELGNYDFSFYNLEIEEKGILLITKHPKTNLGVLTICLHKIKNKASNILSDFIANRFKIDNEIFSEWAKKLNLRLLGTSRGLVFSYTPLTEQEKIGILACENDDYLIKGKEFFDMANTDLAQYDVADVFCSENVLLELPKNKLEKIEDRIQIQAGEIFFLEILLLQDAAISRVCDKIIKEFEKEGRSPLSSTNSDILDNLSSELSESILFLDYNNFIYPPVKISAEKIAHNFGIDKLIKKYNTYESLLESLISVRKNKVDELENSNMSMLLLLLTLTQLVPILTTLFDTIMNQNLSFDNVISFISSIGVCFIILIVFKYINKRKKKKYQDNLLNIKF